MNVVPDSSAAAMVASAVVLADLAPVGAELPGAQADVTHVTSEAVEPTGLHGHSL